MASWDKGIPSTWEARWDRWVTLYQLSISGRIEQSWLLTSGGITRELKYLRQSSPFQGLSRFYISKSLSPRAPIVSVVLAQDFKRNENSSRQEFRTHNFIPRVYERNRGSLYIPANHQVRLRVIAPHSMGDR